MNTQLKGFPYVGYHPTHWFFGGLVALAAGMTLFREQPWGWAMSVFSGIVVSLAVLTSHANVAVRLLVGGILGAIVIASPLVLNGPDVMVLVWLLTSVGTAFLTVNVMYGAPGIPDRATLAFLSLGLAVIAGIISVLTVGDTFPAITWIVWLLGGPFAGWLFGLVGKTEPMKRA